MRRGLLLAGFWALGVVVAVTLAFAAVGRVASGVAPRDVARLSGTAIDAELSGRTSVPPGSSRSTATSGTRSSTSTTGRTEPTTSSSTATTRTTTTIAPSTTVRTTANPPPPPPSTTAVSQPPVGGTHNTATTSEGGTVFTHCSGPNTIVYVAAVPKSGYERTADIEDPNGIHQSFDNHHHRSNIEAACSGGVVRAQVEEESADD